MKKGNTIQSTRSTRRGLLRLVNWTLHENAISFDEYDEKTIKNQAHQLIYKSIAQKLGALRKRRKEFVDESARLFLAEYEKYRSDTSK
jgi:hypothetical protein